MISPMLKYSLLIYHREYEDILDELRDLGVVHILERDLQVSDEIREQYQYIDRIDKAIRYLKKREYDHPVIGGKLYGKDVFNEFTELQSQSEGIINKLNSLRKEIHELTPWGDFSSEMISRLKGEGIIIRFFTAPVRKFDPEWKEQYTVEELNVHGGQVYFIVISRNEEDVNITAEEITPPARSLSSLREEKDKVKEQIEAIEKRFNEMARMDLPALEEYKNSLIQELDYQKALHNTSKEAEDRLMIVEGWVPKESAEKLNNYLNSSSVAHITSNPDPKEKVPVLLKNKAFAKKFEMLGELYSLPSYKEMDLTPFFAPFYALFFGFCLGDVGYGILMAITALVLKGRVKKEVRPVTVLIFYLGLATILFGLIGGTFFGINLYHTGLPVYRNLQSGFEARGTDINNFLFYLSLAMGGVQILFGMILKAINEIIQFGWKLAVGTLGWIVLLVGMVVITGLNRLAGIPMETLVPFRYAVIGTGGLMILLLNNLERNLLLNVGIGLWNSYNMVTGIVGDLLSYIRLFALGISSAILGFVFNSLAVSMSGSIPVLSIIIMVTILVIGHGINLFMSGLGAFVHPMRLTFVEFYKNAGFSGGGRKYNPFRKLI